MDTTLFFTPKNTTFKDKEKTHQDKSLSFTLIFRKQVSIFSRIKFNFTLQCSDVRGMKPFTFGMGESSGKKELNTHTSTTQNKTDKTRLLGPDTTLNNTTQNRR